MSLQLPEGIAQALQGGQGIPQGLEGGGQPEQQDPLQVLQECIQQLPKVIAALPDPQDTQDATQALLTLTKVQTRLMTKQQGSGAPPQG